jgi:hypothetical protein
VVVVVVVVMVVQRQAFLTSALDGGGLSEFCGKTFENKRSV